MQAAQVRLIVVLSVVMGTSFVPDAACPTSSQALNGSGPVDASHQAPGCDGLAQSLDSRERRRNSPSLL
jgi:hypothetical protein